MWKFSHDSGMRVICIEEYFDMGHKAVIEEARKVVGDGPTYISFDVDALDPEPERRKRVGMWSKLPPPFDPTGNTALVGATMMIEILCVLAESLSNHIAT